MVIARLSMGFASLLVIATDANSVEELNLLSLQNRQTRKLEDSIEQGSEHNFCWTFCGASQAGKGCCVSKDGTSKFRESKKATREQCEKTGVWCTGGNKVWAGSDVTKTAGWNCDTEDVCAATTVADTPAPVTVADTPAPVTVADTPAPVTVADTTAPVTVADTPAPVMPVYTDAPVTTTGPQAMWTEYSTGEKCIGQSFALSSAASQHACEEQAILAKHSFYQYNARQGKCATVNTCFTPTPSEGYMVYRNPALWPLNAQGQRCSNKKRHRQDGVESQMECQQKAMAMGTNYYTWNAQKNACIVSKKCRHSSSADASWVTFNSGE